MRIHTPQRDIPAAAMMGQAAGTAAVQAINTARPAFGVDTEALVKTLRQQGAYLPQDHAQAERCY